MWGITIKPNTLKFNISITFLGNVIYSACQFGLITALAKIGDSKMVGQYALSIAIFSPIMMLTNMQLRTVQATSVDGGHSFKVFLLTRIVGVSTGFLILGVFIYINDYSRETSIVMLFLSLAKLSESISDVIYGYFQKLERMEFIAYSLIYKGILSLIIWIVVLTLTKSLLLSSISLFVTNLSVLVVFDLRNVIYYTRREIDVINTRLLSSIKSLIKISYPLGIVMALNSLAINIPRYFIESTQSERALGKFAALSYILVAGNLLIDTVGQSIIPRLSKNYFDFKRSSFLELLKKMLILVATLGFSAVIIVSIYGDYIIKLLYKSEYVDSQLLILITSASVCGYISSVFGYAITATREFNVQLIFSIVGLLTVIIACYSLIPKYGLYGAAISIGCIYIIQMPLRIVVLNRKLAMIKVKAI